MDENFNFISFPIIKRVAARTLAQDLKSFDPGNPTHVKEWEEHQQTLFANLKNQFDEKGIPFPTVVINHEQGPITYGIKTTDVSGNIIHSLL